MTDLDATVNTIPNIGSTVALPRMPIPGVAGLDYVKDPSGNIFGIMQLDPAAFSPVRDNERASPERPAC